MDEGEELSSSMRRGTYCWNLGATLDLAMTNETWTVLLVVVVK